MFVDNSYFVGNLFIPNSGIGGDTDVNTRIDWFIQKHESEFLQKLLGYPLYKAFMAGMNVVAPAVPDIRFINLLYGVEYTDWQSDAAKWKGLIVTDNPTVNLLGGYVYNPIQYLLVDTTPNLVSGANSVVFPQWIGWTPIITRSSFMVPGVDYSYDINTGTLTLLKTGDKFNTNERFKVEFELRTNAMIPVSSVTTKESLIANYIYYKYYTSSTGIGEVRRADNSVIPNYRQKLFSVWNEMAFWKDDLMGFLRDNMTTYPEWTYRNEYETNINLGFLNPHL